MSYRRALDKDGQLSLDSLGKFVRSESQMPSVILALRTPYGSCPVAPTFGNKSAATPANITPATPRRVEADYKAALSHLTNAGLIWELAVTSSAEGSALYTVVAFKDASGSQEIVL